MFPTRSLASKNSLFAAFHEPTYIDRKTSRKILDALVSSFNRSLDKEHGPLPNASSPVARSSPEPEATRRRSSSSRRQHVDSHLGAILSNPMFSYDNARPVPGKASLLASLGPGHVEGREKRRTQVQEPPRRDPMDVFDEAVSKGLMTIPRATGCLVAKRKLLEDSAPGCLKDAMQYSRAGTRIVTWLRSSGAESDLTFLEFPGRSAKNNPNTLFLNSLIPFLLAEGKDGLVWSWFSRVLREKGHGSPEANASSMNASALVVSLIRAQWNTLSEEHHIPYGMVLEIDQRFSDAAAHSSNVETPRAKNLHTSPVFTAWKYVSFHGTMNKIPVPPPPTPVFDQFMNMADPWGKAVEADIAHLDLHHPTHPTPEKAVQYIEQEKPWKQSRRQSQPAWDRNTIPRGSRVVQMGVDAINYFVRRGDKAEAAHVYSLLTQLFPWVPWGSFLDGQTEVSTPSPPVT
ncbi:uncharacterized protein MKZ38_010079 [Zalerion maritima]|uniref:Uncharacterized protein n=1 Tax=Zalerion maritima TaxID=339359 RepID=A0AAD5S107_9PEZI|nr:uncharacterized protein MKZ38_010079 [Zalerion maritima]